MITPDFPSHIGLCFENRDAWQSSPTIIRADEAARWLAPQADISLAEDLVRSIGLNPIRIPMLTYDRTELARLLSATQDLMLWNVTDGIELFCGTLVPSLARLMKIPSFGSSIYVQGLCQNKHHWKAVLQTHGIASALGTVVRGAEVKTPEDLNSLMPPFFVKPTSFGNNAGLSLIEPIAHTALDAVEKAAILINAGLGPVLIEEFVPGREYSVWCFEGGGWQTVAFEKLMESPHLLTEIKDKQPRAASFSMKRVDALQVEALSRKIVQALGINDYVRMDIREDRFGNPIPIDVNTGAFLTGRSFELACTELKGSTGDMFREIVHESWRRQKS